MNYSILLIVKKPTKGADEEYDTLMRTLPTLIKQDKNLQVLAESSFLLPLNEGLQGLFYLLRALRNLRYTYTILTEETQWHEGKNII